MYTLKVVVALAANECFDSDHLCISLTFGTSPATTRRTRYETPDFLSHDADRWAVDFLPAGWSERRVNDSAAARPAVLFTNVRAALRPALRSLSPRRARLPRLRTQ